MRINPWIGLAIAGLLLVGLGVLQVKITGIRNHASTDEPSVGMNLAILSADKLYQEAVRRGVDLTDGPCLADDEIPDWVVDIAHDPRQPVDDLPENQCPSYRSGKAKHFIELSPAGTVIRAE